MAWYLLEKYEIPKNPKVIFFPDHNPNPLSPILWTKIEIEIELTA
jgi:hypothetical protein